MFHASIRGGNAAVYNRLGQFLNVGEGNVSSQHRRKNRPFELAHLLAKFFQTFLGWQHKRLAAG